MAQCTGLSRVGIEIIRYPDPPKITLQDTQIILATQTPPHPTNQKNHPSGPPDYFGYPDPPKSPFRTPRLFWIPKPPQNHPSGHPDYFSYPDSPLPTKKNHPSGQPDYFGYPDPPKSPFRTPRLFWIPKPPQNHPSGHPDYFVSNFLKCQFPA